MNQSSGTPLDAKPPSSERIVRAGAAPLVALLHKMGVDPTSLTFLGLFLNLGAAYVVWTGNLRWGAVAFLGASVFDMLDGSLARLQGKESKLGAFLDSTFDRISETALFVALLHDILLRGWGPSWLPEITLVALAGSLSTSYARARAEGLGLSCKVGWLERPERVLLLTVGLAAGESILGYVLFALAVLSWVTTGQRIAHIWQALGGPPK
jgi:CDP-diacylglycerol--glycerol-3-phosphate 3-phosphatidyltransferase